LAYIEKTGEVLVLYNGLVTKKGVIEKGVRPDIRTFEVYEKAILPFFRNYLPRHAA